MRKLIILGLQLIIYTFLFSAYMENISMQVKQPDAEIINCYASGDEFFNYLHDKEGYTILQSETDGYYYYAEKHNGQLTTSKFKVNTVDPRIVHLEKNVLISKEEYIQRRSTLEIREDRSSPSTGTVNNITILIRFADQVEYDNPRSVFLNRFNSLHPDSVSMKSYFDEVSYNSLNIETSIYPISSSETNLSYVDLHPRAYYSPYNAVTNPIGYEPDDRTIREHTLLKNAIEAMENQIPTSLNLDGDGDGYLDNICFIIRGQNDAWAQLLWAHKWSLYSFDVNIHGVNVDTYTFQPESQNNVRTLSHEMFHSLGSPDLYHYEHDFSTPVGVWDIMERGSGHMLNWMKYRYANWLAEPEIISSGTYNLNLNLNSNNNYYKIIDPNDNTEFFIVEYRSNLGGLYESNLPESGLLLYRVNPNFYGNAYDGDEIYVYRHDGTIDNDGNILDACINMEENNNVIGNNTNPVIFFSNGYYAGFSISINEMNSESINFTLNAVSQAPSIKIVSLSNLMSYYKGVLSLKIKKLNNAEISNVTYYLDGTLMSTQSNANEYAYNLDLSAYEGWHTIRAVAVNTSNQMSADSVRINLLNAGTYWFDWMNDFSENASIAPGVVPFSVAVAYDLNNNIAYVKKIAMDLRLDPTGISSNPGIVNAKIVNTDVYGYPGQQVIHNFGEVNVSLDSLTVFILPDNIDYPVTGRFAFQLDIPEFHQLMVDTSGVTGYTWRTNSDWAWKNLCSYGIFGTAIMGLELSSAVSENDNEDLSSVSAYDISNYPNPFNPQTNISFVLLKDMKAIVDIYNCKGQLVRSIDKGYLSKGKHVCSFNGLNTQQQKLSSGVYLYRLRGVSGKSGKMLLLK